VVDWSDPETFWLNVMNAALGLVTLVALALVVGSVVVEVLEKVRHRIASAVKADVHALLVPGLGATMADGGEKTGEEKKS